MKQIILLSVFISCLIFSSCEGPKQGKQNLPTKKDTTIESKEMNNEDQMFVLFFGNSLTAGYGLEEEESFPSLIQNKIDELGLPYKVINAGLSGETTANGSERIDWILKQDIDIFVLELGANDMLRGLSIEQTKTNLDNIIKKVKRKDPNIKVILAGMKAAPNMGPDYVEAFDNVFPDLARKHSAGLIPFLLEGVASIDSLNLNDGKHPNSTGQKIVASTVWEVLEKYLDNK